MFYLLGVATLDYFCCTLMGKTELKVSCTKNFKALYVNFTKYNGTGFWGFGADMPLQPFVLPSILSIDFALIWNKALKLQIAGLYLLWESGGIANPIRALEVALI